MDIKLDEKYLKNFISENDFNQIIGNFKKAYNLLKNKNGEGNNFLGWLNLPSSITKKKIEKIKNTARRLQEISDIIIVIGIGGSYLGARAVIEAIKGNMHNEFNKVKIIFAGYQISPDYLNNIINLIKNKNFSIIVISKSGTTTEPAITFRILRKILEKKYKEKSNERIIAITDKEKGALRKLSENNRYKTFDIPDNIGGRYSVLTPVGLLPIQIAGINIEKVIEGAKLVEKETENDDSTSNPINRYAIIRNILYNKGKKIEILVNFEPSLHYFAEWWKQLFGESEGKNGKGLFPAGLDFSTDLHSIGQWIQEGEKIIFETFLIAEKSKTTIEIEKEENDLDNLNYLAGKDLHYINHKAFEGSSLAHYDGDVPNISLIIPELSEFYIGQLIYFFEKACAISGYMLGVNPFNQPGVEKYKTNMFKLLNKPGY